MYQYDFSNIRPVFSGHETFPLRYGWLKKAYDQLLANEELGLNARDLFNSDEAISIFGVGKNMVSSIRHWATYTQLIKDNTLTNFAHLFFADDGLDPWLENTNTLWLLHWFIARTPTLVSYFMLFNFFNGLTFSRHLLEDEIINFCHKNNLNMPAATTLKRDVECIIRLYSKAQRRSARQTALNDSNIIESPLAELGLIISTQQQGTFALNWGKKPPLSPNLFILSIIYYWQRSGSSRSSISLESLLYDPFSPGRLFLMDEYSFIEKIMEAEPYFKEYFTWSETAGMRQLIRQNNLNLDEAYTNIKNQFINEYTNKA